MPEIQESVFFNLTSIFGLHHDAAARTNANRLSDICRGPTKRVLFIHSRSRDLWSRVGCRRTTLIWGAKVILVAAKSIAALCQVLLQLLVRLILLAP